MLPLSAEAMPAAVAIRAAATTAVVRALVTSRCMAALIPSHREWGMRLIIILRDYRLRGNVKFQVFRISVRSDDLVVDDPAHDTVRLRPQCLHPCRHHVHSECPGHLLAGQRSLTVPGPVRERLRTRCSHPVPGVDVVLGRAVLEGTESAPSMSSGMGAVPYVDGPDALICGNVQAPRGASGSLRSPGRECCRPGDSEPGPDVDPGTCAGLFSH